MNVRIPLTRLFHPGRGKSPPHFAGREAELKTFDEKGLGYLLDGNAPDGDFVLFGPRGNGKTALLNEFSQSCATASVTVRFGDPEAFGGDEATPASFARWLLNEKPKRRASGGSAGIGPAHGSTTWENPDADRALLFDFPERLIAGSRKNPLVALIDEAHTIPPRLLKFALNAAQTVNREGGPFLLVLAGTPQLRETLKASEATFWSRCEKIGVGRIASNAAREALARPLAERGIGFDEDALKAVVEESQRYPYFVQIWGQALCATLTESGERRIDIAAVDTARPAFEAEQTDYCEDRYDEFDSGDLLEAAEATARALKRTDDHTLRTLRNEIARALGKPSAELKSALSEMLDLGFVWRPPGGTRVEPGIPSLMDFTLEQRKIERAQARRAGAAAAEPEPENAPSP